MEKWLLMVESHCTVPSRENEYNNWYYNIHLPDVLKSPGFVGVKRYVIKEPRNGRGKFLTVCEIETDDINKTYATRLEFRKRETDEGRSAAAAIPNLLLHAWSDVLFEQIAEGRRNE